MNLNSLIGKEIWKRKSQLISGLLAVSLGIGVIVCIRTISEESEKTVAIKLDNLGANIMVLPQATGVDDYYAADIDAPTIPEEYVEKIVTSTLPGVDNLSPKLTRRIKIGENSIVLTGILPKSEIASKPIWQQGGLQGAALSTSCAPSQSSEPAKYKDEKLQRKGIEELDGNDCYVGSSVVTKLGLKEGSKFDIEGTAFNVVKVLPETGTLDDDRIFANLHTVQSVLGIPEQVSAIEIMGCCNEISDGLLGKLRNLLPDTRIITINQIVATQQQTNKLMRSLSWIILVIIFVVGGVSIGNNIWANVNERRREIGILRMIGYHKGTIYYILITKAVLIGIVGGLIGYVLGTLAAVEFGSQIVGSAIQPDWIYILYSILLAVGIAIVGSFIPAFLAGKIEPYTSMQES